MKKIIVINLIVVISLIFLLEIFANIFKLSGLMGMDANLLFKKMGYSILNLIQLERFLIKKYLLISTVTVCQV